MVLNRCGLAGALDWPTFDKQNESHEKVDHKNKLYVFSKFLLKTPTIALLMHSNDIGVPMDSQGKLIKYITIYSLNLW